MTPKTPTASGISRLLSSAGFKRADVKSWRADSGYRARKDGNRNAVRVSHVFLSMGVSADRHREQLARYARTITEAGWTVEAGTYELIVTAREGADALSRDDGDHLHPAGCSCLWCQKKGLTR